MEKLKMEIDVLKSEMCEVKEMGWGSHKNIDSLYKMLDNANKRIEEQNGRIATLENIIFRMKRDIDTIILNK